MVSCKLSLDITKNSYYTDNVWCSVLIDYKSKTFFDLELSKQIRVEYNSASIPMIELDEDIYKHGGVAGFMRYCIESVIKVASKKTDLDLRIEDLMNQTVEIELSKDELKMLRK